MKLNQLIEEWLYSYHKDNVKPQTFMRYECAYKNYILNDKLGQTNIKRITPRDMQEFINEKKKLKSRVTKNNMSANNINILITVLRSAFSYAVDFGLLKENPCDKIKRMSTKNQKKVVAFTVPERLKIEQHIRAMKDPEYYGIILCLYTGIRIGELLALEWKDINFEKGIMSINKTVYVTKNEYGDWYLEENLPKTNSSIREIPLPYYILDDLKELKKSSNSKKVVTKKDGGVMRAATLRERFTKLTKELGVRSLNFHALRHTFATRALESGMDVRTLADVMGHANAGITLNVYTHSMTDHKINMMNNIPNLIQPVENPPS